MIDAKLKVTAFPSSYKCPQCYGELTDAVIESGYSDSAQTVKATCSSCTESVRIQAIKR